MWSVLATAWRVVIRRAIADRVILLAAVLTILLATMLVASGPIYADAVSLSAVRRTLADAEVQDANAEISARVTPVTFADTNERISQETMRAFALTGGAIFRRGTSDSYALPDQPGESVTDLAVFRFFDRIEEFAEIIEGAWPEHSGEPYQTAISEPTAAFLNLSVGDELEMTNRRDGDIQAIVQVTGIYRIDAPGDPYWYEAALDIEGITEGSSFTTYGPFVVTPETFFEALTPFSSEVRWRVYPFHENLTVSGVTPLRQQLEALERRLNQGRDAGNRVRVETGLVRILRETERSLLVTRSSVLILTIQLAVLAGYALLLTAGLLADSREVETNLLRSRGASSRQILAMAGMEGMLLTVPAALIAPPLAAFVLRSLNLAGPLSEINLSINPVITQASYAIAAIAALGCLVALAWPAFRSAQQFGEVRAARSRESARGMVQRAGLDLALVIVAIVAFWQLQRFGAPITQTVQGRLGIDPLLVAAPALGLLAGGVIALRTLPLISRAAESLTSRSTRVVPALGAWQVARRPLRYARAALLLVLATGIGLFAVSYATTWRESQGDQAAYQTGADLRVQPDRRFGSAVPAHVLQDAYADLPGFVEVMPVQREFGQLSRSTATARFVLLDAARATDTVQFRPDLADEPLEDLMARLAAGRLAPATIPLPGVPARIAVDLSFEVEPLPAGFELPRGVRPSRVELTPVVRAVLIDGNDQIFRLDLGPVEQTGESIRVSRDLDFALENGGRLRPAYPLALVALEVRTAAPQEIVRQARLVFEGLQVSADNTSDIWQPVPVSLEADAWDLSVTDLALAIERPVVSPAPGSSDGLALDLESGATTSQAAIPIVFGLRPAGSPAAGPLAVLVSSDLMREGSLEVGDELPLSSLIGYDGNGIIVGEIEEFPTVEPERGRPVVLDYQSFLATIFEPGAVLPLPDEYWLAVDEPEMGRAAEILTADPLSSARVASRTERMVTLESDPVALGTIGSLMLGFVAAAVFAGIGFAVNAAVSARERQVEFALLRAVGLSNRQMVGWLTIENAALVLFGLAGGTVLGVALAWLVLPLISITQQATQAVPSVIVVYPWRTILWLQLGILGVLVAAVGLLAVMLRRMGLGELLRLGED